MPNFTSQLTSVCLFYCIHKFPDGSDYTDPGTLTFIFNRDETSFEVMIPLIDDDVHELNENFFASLASNEDANILTLNPANATVNILDNEGIQRVRSCLYSSTAIL